MSQAPNSPCIAVCCVDPKIGCCEGCFRTLKEIAGWGGLSAAEQWAVIRETKRRKAELTAAGKLG